MNQYRLALEVQDAVNLRAIARLLVAAADVAADAGGTRASYDDPAVILIVSKIESLVRSQESMRFQIAFENCRTLAERETQEDLAV